MTTRIVRFLLVAAFVVGLYGAFATPQVLASQDQVYMVIKPYEDSKVSGKALFTDNHDDTTTVEIALDEAIFAQASLNKSIIERAYAREQGIVLNDVVDGTSTTVVKFPLEKLMAENYMLLIKVNGGIVAVGTFIQFDS